MKNLIKNLEKEVEALKESLRNDFDVCNQHIDANILRKSAIGNTSEGDVTSTVTKSFVYSIRFIAKGFAVIARTSWFLLKVLFHFFSAFCRCLNKMYREYVRQQQNLLSDRKRQAYDVYGENLWRVLYDFQEDFKIRISGRGTNLFPNNPFVLRGGVWMYCYRASKKNKSQFDNEHLEFIRETCIAELSSLLQCGEFVGVTYPCNLFFYMDEIVDIGSEILIYVLFVENEADVEYIRRKNTVDHQGGNRPDRVGDEDF